MPTAHRSTSSLIVLAVLMAGCGGGSKEPPVATPPPAAPAPERFWVEPATTVVIGRGQEIRIYAALQSQTDAYPKYQTASDVTWSTSQPNVASVDADGVVVALEQGTTAVTSRLRGLTASLEVRVDGTMDSHPIGVTGQGIRRYSIYTPSGLDPTELAPLLVAAHGGGGSAMIQAATTLLNTLAHQEQLRIVYLEGSGAIQTFNAGACCGFARAQNIDDVAYVRAVLDDVQSRVGIDPSRTFATGFSNGAMLSYRLACTLSDRISGIAAVGGASGQFDFDRNSYYDCNPTRPIPILHIHATNDRNYPLAGGFGAGISDTNYYPVENTVTDWITRNNVTAAATMEQVTPTTVCRHYREPANAAQPSAPVAFCTINPLDVYDAATEIVFGGGHSWPGGVRSPAAASDTPPQDFNANAYLWSYFSQ